MEFKSEYEIDINEIVYKVTYSQIKIDLARDLYMNWERTFLKYVELKFYEIDDKEYYDRYVEKQKFDFKNYGGSEVLWHQDNLKGNFISFIGEFNLYLSNHKDSNYKIIEIDEYKFKNLFPTLFLMKLYFIDSMDVFDFLDYQIVINFNDNILEFINFYTKLKHFCSSRGCIELFDKNDGVVKDYLSLKEGQEQVVLNEIPEIIIERSKSKPLSIPQKILFLKEIKFFEMLYSKFPKSQNFNNRELASLIKNIIVTGKVDSIRKVLSAIDNNYTSSPYNRYYAYDLISAIELIPSKHKILKELFSDFPKLKNPNFWDEINLILNK